MKRAIITGATSFIGLHLIKRLIIEDWKIYAVVRSENAKTFLLPPSKQIEFIYLNMENYRQLGEFIREPCDVYISLAWNGTRGAERSDAEKQEKNYIYSMEALKAVVKSGCKMAISAGSQAEYGPMLNRVSETSICHPNTEYGRWKLKYYNDGINYCGQSGISFKEPRFFSLYGENDNDQTMILSILKCMMNDIPCELTQCIQLWDFLYIEDAIDGIMRLVNIPCEDGAYNFGSGDIRPLKDFVMEMYRITNSKSRLMFGAIPYPDTGMVNVCPDISKLQKQTGWMASTSFANGIQKIIDYRQKT